MSRHFKTENTLCERYVCLLPEQLFIRHVRDSLTGPVQAGGDHTCRKHIRFRVWIPRPHVPVHSLQSFQSDHLISYVSA